MNVRPIYLYLLGAALVLFILSRTQKGQEVTAAVTDAIASTIGGIRRNNPLNIERGDPWIGLSEVQTHNRFATFDDMPHGIRAAAIILRNYQRKYGIRTVQAAVSRWDQDPGDPIEEYIETVSNYLGVQKDTVLNFEDRATVFSYLRGAMIMEVGRAGALLVSDADVNAGLDLAGFA